MLLLVGSSPLYEYTADEAYDDVVRHTGKRYS